MSRSRAGLSRSIFSSTTRDARFTRDRTDGGGGGTDDADDTGEDSEDTVEDDDEDGEDEDEGPKPILKADGTPFTQADLDALNLALKNARRDARQARKGDKGGDAGKDPDEAAQEATQAAEAKWKPVLVNREARSALKLAGLKGEPGPLLKLLDLDEIDVADDGEVEGLDEQISDLKRQYPDLFASKKRGTIDGADKDRSNNGKKRSASEIQADALRGVI